AHDPAHTEQGLVAHDSIDEKRHSAQEEDGCYQNATPSVKARIAGAHRRGELGVLGKRPLDLLEHPLLMLREGHGPPPRASTAGPVGPARPPQPNGYVSTSLRAGQLVGK